MQVGKGNGWDPQASVSFWLNRASRALLRSQDGRLRPLGFAMSQMPVLHALKDGARRSQTELAAWAHVEQPSMAQLLGRMERDGVVQRTPHPSDGRASLYALTRRARARWDGAKQCLVDVERAATTGLSPAEHATLLDLLRRVLANLEG